MKALRLLITTLGMLALASGSAYAFHDGGVAYCQGCHTMHNSQNNALVDPNHPQGNAYLLNYGNASDTCLRCHAAYGQFATGSGFGPGGDFYWVTKTWTWTTPRSGSSLAQTHGHNVISPAYGIVRDPTLSYAPGGDFLSQYLGCTSCHDPHGNQNFRLLYGDDFGPVYNGGRYDFDNPAPVAEGNGRRTINEDGWETNAHHTIYKSGMSEWCANCHTALHDPNTTNFVHPTSDDLGSTVAATYNAYISSDQLVGGDPATSYWGLVPFEAVNVDFATADPANYTQGPTPQDQVMCLSCHRSHASPFSDIGRWQFNATHIADSRPLAGDPGATAEDIARKYYQYTFVHNQRSLCNKCHAKDAGDGPYPSGH